MNWLKQINIFNIDLASKTIIFIALLLFLFNLYNKEWNRSHGVIFHDIYSYYGYLTSTFIHHDVTLSFVEENPELYSKKYIAIDLPTGKKLIITSIGMAYIYAPFFFIAHFIANTFGYPVDGYSVPYKVLLQFSSMIYFLIGLIFLRKTLKVHFEDKVIAIVLLVITFATNIFHYVSFEATMPHVYNFSLISIFIYFVGRWYKSTNILNSIILGLLIGFIAIIRPTNILILFVLVFWNITSVSNLQIRIRFFIKSYKLILLMVFMCILIWAPQFIYWKITTGSYFFFSYGQAGGGFFFNNPQIINQLFSYKKGWLIYTPIMGFAIMGIPFIYKKYKELFLPLIFLLPAHIYILSSWWSWWFGGGFGMRSYIDIYSILAFPLAAAISIVLVKKLIVKIPIFTILLFFLGLNLFQIYQYNNGIIHWAYMSKAAYWDCFGKVAIDRESQYLLLEPYDRVKAQQGIYEKIPKEYLIKKRAVLDCIPLMIEEIKNSKHMRKIIEEKALRKRVSIEEMTRLEAEWICTHQILGDEKYVY